MDNVDFSKGVWDENLEKFIDIDPSPLLTARVRGDRVGCVWICYRKVKSLAISCG